MANKIGFMILTWLLCTVNSAFASENFVAGLYADNKGNNYIVSGQALSQNNRTQWSIFSLGTQIKFGALWETGAATGNTYVGNTGAITSNAGNFPAGVAYGITGISSWGTGNLISANQVNNTVLNLTGLSSNGNSSGNSLALSRLGDSNVATASASSISFVAGIYADFSGSQYLVSGPAPSQTGRQQWTVLLLDSSTPFSALWETGTALGNTYIGNLSSVVSNANGYPVGRAYGITGYTSSWGTGNELSASQTGNVLTLTRLSSNGTASGSSLALIKVAETDAATSSASSESFVTGTYTDFSGTPYLVSGPAPSQTGRTQWSVTSLDPNDRFSALWETGTAVGNTYIGNDSDLTQYANGYLTGRTYGITGENSDFGTGNIISASQTGNILMLNRLSYNGTPAGYSVTLLKTGANALAGSSVTSESFTAGTYTDQAGRVYQVQGGGNTWSITSPALAPYQFSANWQTGAAASNYLVSSNSDVKNYPAGYPLGRSYGTTGANTLGWGNGSVISANQVGNVLTLTGLRYNGLPNGYSMTLVAGGYAGSWSSTSAGQVQLRDSAISVIKNEVYAKIYVTRSGGGKGAAGVAWLTTDGTAQSGVDYIGGSGSLSWSDGDVSTKTISVKLKANTRPAGKSFSIQLNNPAIVTIGSPSTATVTLQPVTYAANSDRLFDWAESVYPSLFPNHQTSQIYQGSYFFRCYSVACVASGMGGDLDSLYYLDLPSGALSRLGGVRAYLNQTSGF